MSLTTHAFRKMYLLAIIVGVIRVAITSAESDQSEAAMPQDMVLPMENAGKRQLNTPEVYLQLKYDEGELKRIYLAQFRKPEKIWRPSVTDRSNLCADLCYAGLGGPACGSSCSQLIPMGLHSALNTEHTNTTEHPNSEHTDSEHPDSEHLDSEHSEHSDVGVAKYGQPRVAVCPTLCENFMGQPLCQCVRRYDEMVKVNWEAICEAFCQDGYNLGGCPTCTSAGAGVVLRQRLLGTAEGWAAWCDVQCRQGHGGAACNCDRTPF